MTYKHVKPTNEHEKWAGAATMDLSEVTPEDYVQAKGLWDVLSKQPGQQDNFVGNVSGHLSAAKEDTRKRTYEMFSKVDPQLGAKIAEATEKLAPAEGSQAAGSAQSRL
jgi:catalase